MDWREFAAGGFAGTVSLAAGHPLDTVKVLVQNAPGRTSYAAVVREVIARGLPAFFRGMSLPLVAYASNNAVIFGAYRTGLAAVGGDGDLWRVAAAGAFSGVCSLVPNVPVEVVKVRLQKDAAAGQREFRGPLHCLRVTLSRHGPAGLYHGLASNAARDTLGVMAMFVAYEALLRRLRTRPGWSESAVAFVAGGLSGLASWGSVVPLDVLKTRVQARAPGESGQEAALWREVWREGAAMRGIGALLWRALIVNAITFYVYELSVRWMRIREGGG